MVSKKKSLYACRLHIWVLSVESVKLSCVFMAQFSEEHDH